MEVASALSGPGAGSFADSSADSSPKLDLLVLATCSGGTPRSIRALSPYVRYLIASPEDLHLSYFDLRPLARLDIGSEDDAVFDFAAAFARHAFEQLSSEVQTPVSVVLYDTEQTQTYLDSVTDAYDLELAVAESMPKNSFERCDCAALHEYTSPTMGNGLTVLYRAPRFGRMKSTTQHSGWECWRAVR